MIRDGWRTWAFIGGERLKEVAAKEKEGTEEQRERDRLGARLKVDNDSTELLTLSSSSSVKVYDLKETWLMVEGQEMSSFLSGQRARAHRADGTLGRELSSRPDRLKPPSASFQSWR